MTENEAKAKLERTSVLWESATNTEMVEAVKLAIKALEKQIAQKIIEVPKFGKELTMCPKCNMGLYAGQPYCEMCGQKLDWEDGE